MAEFPWSNNPQGAALGGLWGDRNRRLHIGSRQSEALICVTLSFKRCGRLSGALPVFHQTVTVGSKSSCSATVATESSPSYPKASQRAWTSAAQLIRIPGDNQVANNLVTVTESLLERPRCAQHRLRVPFSTSNLRGVARQVLTGRLWLCFRRSLKQRRGLGDSFTLPFRKPFTRRRVASVPASRGTTFDRLFTLPFVGSSIQRLKLRLRRANSLLTSISLPRLQLVRSQAFQQVCPQTTVEQWHQSIRKTRPVGFFSP